MKAGNHFVFQPQRQRNRYRVNEILEVHARTSFHTALYTFYHVESWQIATDISIFKSFRCTFLIHILKDFVYETRSEHVERVLKREQEVESLSRPRAEFIYFTPFTWGDSSCIRSACLSLLASEKSSTRSLPLTPNWPQIVLSCTFHCVVVRIKGLSLM